MSEKIRRMVEKLSDEYPVLKEKIREDLGLIPPMDIRLEDDLYTIKNLLDRDKNLYSDRKRLFGRYLKLNRQLLTFESAEELAEFTGLPVREIKAYESGKYLPDERTIRKLSEVLLDDVGLLVLGGIVSKESCKEILERRLKSIQNILSFLERL
jgi:transcriptional regulator with XRE-family HTH domain